MTSATRSLAAFAIASTLLLHGPVLSAQPAPTWSLVREATLGANENDDRALLTRVRALLPAPDGSLIVTDVPPALRVFQSNGAFSRFIGRPGRGPGEFQSPSPLGLLGDTLWLADGGLRRTSLLRLDGSVIGTMPWENVTARDAKDGARVVNGLFADGTAWGENDGHLAVMLRGHPEPPKALVRMTRSARVLDTIAVVPTAHARFAAVTPEVTHFGSQHFADAPIIVGASALSRLYVVYRAASADARPATVRVLAINANGDTSWARSIPYQPRLLEKTAADSFVQSVLKSASRREVPEDVIRRALFIPAFRPPVSAAFVSDDGTLWLRREEGRELVDHLILSEPGDVIGTATLPRGISLMAARGAHVWGVEHDADDVPTVVRFRVVR